MDLILAQDTAEKATPKHVNQTAAEKAFHGWRVVFVSAIANAVSMGLGTLNLGLFIQPMESDLNISRTTFGLAGSFRQVAGAFSSPFIGSLIDKHGVRFLLPVATIIGCACIAGVAFISEGWHLLVLFAIVGLVGLIGPGQLLTTVPVTKWFVVLRPRAIALMSLGIPLGALIFMPLTQTLIDDIGWRQTWLVLAVIGVVVICPLTLIWMRREPEDHDQQPDGGIADENALHQNQQEALWTLAAARRQPVFWQLAFTMGMVAFALSTVALHRLPEFIDKGIDPMYVGLAIAWDAVLAGVATYFIGSVGHRLSVRTIGLYGFSLLGVGVVLTIFVTGLPSLLLAMTVWGVGVGAMMYVSNIVWAEYFGREHVGAIRGFVTPITLLLGASGAPIAGYIFDQSGSYDVVWWGSAALMFVSGVLIRFAKPPTLPSARPT
ncbi:MAG: MFS family permease [Candidatus Azotimanducaceae bacterium]